MRAMDAPHRKRCKRYDVPGDAHFLTFSCFRRQAGVDEPLAIDRQSVPSLTILDDGVDSQLMQ